MYPKHGASPMVEFPPPYRVKRLIFLVVSRGYCWHSTNMCLKSFRWNNRVLLLPAIVSLHTLGRVRSIVNYDIFYGIFLRGFANICAVSNSVIYDRAYVRVDSGRAYRRQRGQDRPKGQPIDAVSVFFYPVTLLDFFVSFSAWKRKSRTSCQPIALALGRSVLGRVIERNHARTCEDHPYCRKWSSEVRRGEQWRVAGRASRMSAFLWWDGRRRRTIEPCSTFPEWVGAGEEQENTQSLLPKKGRLSSEKVDTLPRGKPFAGLLCNRARAKRELTKNKKRKRKKERSRKRSRARSVGQKGPRSKKLTVSFTVSRAFIVKHDSIFSLLGPKIP